MKTSELIGPALDWAVCKALGLIDLEIEIGAGMGKAKAVVIDEYGLLFDMGYGTGVFPSTNWEQGGPIIEREKIWLRALSSFWHAQYGKADEAIWNGIGPTPLVAAMRCFVASKLGDEIDIPEELT